MWILQSECQHFSCQKCLWVTFAVNGSSSPSSSSFRGINIKQQGIFIHQILERYTFTCFQQYLTMGHFHIMYRKLLVIFKEQREQIVEVVSFIFIVFLGREVISMCNLECIHRWFGFQDGMLVCFQTLTQVICFCVPSSVLQALVTGNKNWVLHNKSFYEGMSRLLRPWNSVCPHSWPKL